MGAIPAEIGTADWGECFRFAARPALACPHVAGHARPDEACAFAAPLEPFGPEEVAEVLALCEGSPQKSDWLGVFRLRDGRFACLRARCCGAGWGCHADGSAHVARGLAELVRYGLTEVEARRAELGW
jgi:hypothetical protein